MKQYKALFLDWDDTIGDFKNAAFRSLQDIFEQYGLSECYDSFDDYFATYHKHNVWLWDQYGLDQVTKDYLEFDRFFYPMMMAPRPFPMSRAAELAQQMAKAHLEHTTDYFQPLPNAIEVVRYLASKYPLTIVSNGFVEVQYKKINRSGLADCFRHVVLSEEVGCQKPNKRIYEIALEKNGLKAKDVLMIGDSWTSDIQGAINAGIDQLWIQDSNLGQDLSLPATYKVAHFKDVMQML